VNATSGHIGWRGQNRQRFKIIAPRDKAKHWIIQGFHRMRLVALVKRCVIFGEGFVRVNLLEAGRANL